MINLALFHSAAMREVGRRVERIAPKDEPVLITGETGTVKDMVVDLIHARSGRGGAKLVKINFTALPLNWIEPELFGRAQGGPSSARADQAGVIEEAENGSLFLDELCSMPIDSQRKLLRVLQERAYCQIGGQRSFQVNCRVIAATAGRADIALNEGKLCAEFYQYISGFSVVLSSLRERREDIMPLATAFLRHYAAQAEHNVTGFTPAARDLLNSSDWPGNETELQNEICAAVLHCRRELLDVEDIFSSRAPRGHNLN
jgi:DNA-binding NtrC family response regulator